MPVCLCLREIARAREREREIRRVNAVHSRADAQPRIGSVLPSPVQNHVDAGYSVWPYRNKFFMA
jgi:hypothetical protein